MKDPVPPPESRQPPLGRAQWRQIGLLTLGALAVFAGFRWLPTGTNLSHMDFSATGANSIEFCDPLNPQFIPVVTVTSPVTLTLVPVPPAPGAGPVGLLPGREARLTVTLRTASGKPIAPEDLLVTHTRKLHLLIVDPWLEDYQHVHPEPGARPGDWTVAFTPRREGRYRVFADFTPVATARGLYAAADLPVGRAGLPPAYSLVLRHEPTGVVEQDGFRFALVPGVRPVRAKQPADLKLLVSRADGGRVPLEPVMGAFAHLVAFDEACSGFAHLHPWETDLAHPPDPAQPALNFKLTLPQPGPYVVWAQVNLAGRERFVPFWFDVVP